MTHRRPRLPAQGPRGGLQSSRVASADPLHRMLDGWSTTRRASGGADQPRQPYWIGARLLVLAQEVADACESSLPAARNKSIHPSAGQSVRSMPDSAKVAWQITRYG